MVINTNIRGIFCHMFLSINVDLLNNIERNHD